MKENDVLNYYHILMMNREKKTTIKFTNKHYEHQTYLVYKKMMKM